MVEHTHSLTTDQKVRGSNPFGRADIPAGHSVARGLALIAGMPECSVRCSIGAAGEAFPHLALLAAGHSLPTCSRRGCGERADGRAYGVPMCWVHGLRVGSKS